MAINSETSNVWVMCVQPRAKGWHFCVAFDVSHTIAVKLHEIRWQQQSRRNLVNAGGSSIGKVSTPDSDPISCTSFHVNRTTQHAYATKQNEILVYFHRNKTFTLAPRINRKWTLFSRTQFSVNVWCCVTLLQGHDQRTKEILLKKKVV